MKSFYVLINLFRPRSAFTLSCVFAVLFIGLSVTGTVHAQNANPVSISPSSGSGSVQAFIATYTNPNSVMDIQSLSLFIVNGVAPDSKSGWSANTCVLNYTIGSGVIQLVQDAGGAFLSNTATAGTVQTVSNSQCTVLAILSSANVSGNSVTVTFYVEFTAAFKGAKQLYLSTGNPEIDNNTNFPMQVGNYNVTSSVFPLSVFPSSGSGSEQTFTTVYSDETTQVASVFFNIKSSANNTSAANACKLRYDLYTTDILLVNDAGTHYSSPITSGSTTPLSNSQCTVYGVDTYAITSGNYVVVYFHVSFAPGFEGEKKITMAGVDETGASSVSNGAVGTYTVTTPPPNPTPNFTLTNTSVSIAPVGVPATSTITITPRGGFVGSMALTCTVIGPAIPDPPTCAFATSPTISVNAETTATLVVNTTAASTATLHNPLQQIFAAAGSITVAVLLFPVLPIRQRWQTSLSLLVLAIIAGAAGCGTINGRVIAPIGRPGTTDPGTAPGNYIVAVTGTGGATTATTAVSVTVK